MPSALSVGNGRNSPGRAGVGHECDRWGASIPPSKFGLETVFRHESIHPELSELKADASRLLDKVRDEPGKLVLTQNGHARVVVEDYDQYQARERALSMLKPMVQGEGDVADGGCWRWRCSADAES
jgi:prevent-host-death family protein